MTPDKTEDPPAKNPDQLRVEIAEIRAELGDTVEALAAKTDVKAQARAKVEHTKVRLGQVLSRYAPWPQLAAGAVVTVVALVISGRTLRARRAAPPRRRRAMAT